MALRIDRVGGWELVRPATRSEHDGVEMVGYRDRGGQGLDTRVLPESGLTIVLVLDGEVQIDRRDPVVAGLVSGMGVNAVPVRGREVVCVDIHLSPLAAHAVLEGAVGELAGTVVGLEDVLGGEARRLRGAVARTERWQERFSALRAALGQKLHAYRGVDAEVAFAWRELVASGGQRRIGGLAAETGWSRKRLRARFAAQIGVPPERAAMLVRLSLAIEALVAGAAPVDVATRYGYADQAHLARDLKELAGYTPTSLYRDRQDAGYESATSAPAPPEALEGGWVRGQPGGGRR